MSTHRPQGRLVGSVSAKSLPEIVAAAGIPLRDQGHSYGSNTCPSCGEAEWTGSNRFNVFIGRSDGKWRFKCHSCGIKGDAADFVAIVEKVSLSEALKMLDGGNFRPRNKVTVKPTDALKTNPQPEYNEALHKALLIIREKAVFDDGREYLRSRRLDNATIDTAIKDGQLRFLPTDRREAYNFLIKEIGRDLLLESTLWNPKRKVPAQVFRPIVFLDPACYGAEFRVIGDPKPPFPKTVRWGTMKWPWFFKTTNVPKSALIVEGFIDTLSTFQSVREADAFVGVPGTNGWRREWFEQINKAYPGIRFLSGMDDDKPGHAANEGICACLEELGFPHDVLSPPCEGDWNESLRVYL